MPAPALTVVVPAYRAAAFIGRTLDGLAAVLGGLGLSHDVIVSDDGSGDGTADAARRALSAAGLAGRVLDGEPNRGKGHAVRRGMLQAAGERVAFMDHDLPFEPTCFDAALARLDAGDDVAIGDRTLPGARDGVPRSWVRRASSVAFTSVISTVVLPGYWDTQAGFKAFTRRAARRLFFATRVDGFAFDVEVLRLARHDGMRVGRFPVRLVNDDVSTVRVLPHAAHMLTELAAVLGRRRPALVDPPDVLPPCGRCGGEGWDRALDSPRGADVRTRCRRCGAVEPLAP